MTLDRKRKKESTEVHHFVRPAISKPVCHYTEELDSFDSHDVSAWTYDMEAGDLSKTLMGYLKCQI